MKTIRSFETPGRTNLATQYCIPRDVNP